MLAYLAAETARDRLIQTGKCTIETAPALELLEFALTEHESIIDDWAGYRLAPTEYREKLTTNNKGQAVMSKYPVLSVTELMSYQDHAVGISPLPIPQVRISSIWRQDRILYFNVKHVPIEVVYIAGLDPLPDRVSRAAWQLLVAVFEEGQLGGNLSFLYEPDRQVSSISLPGGLSKSFRYPSESGSSKPPQTVLDRILLGLGSLRRRTVTVN
jgi:hypothetical protein